MNYKQFKKVVKFLTNNKIQNDKRIAYTSKGVTYMGENPIDVYTQDGKKITLNKGDTLEVY